jgi:hypothetical protein
MLSDVYGHVVIHADEDEWGAFWQEAYQAQNEAETSAQAPSRWGQERVSEAANGEPSQGLTSRKE